jgi:flagellar protein FlbD
VIQLTRIDGTTFYLNPDLVEVVEATHDTHITLVNGHKYVCSEAPELIVERIVEYRRAIMATLRRIA